MNKGVLLFKWNTTTGLTDDEFISLDSGHGKILESWVNNEMSNEEFFSKSVEMMKDMLKHSVSFGDDENLFELFLHEVSSNSDWIRKTIHHEKHHAKAIRDRGWIPEYILMKLDKDRFVPSVKTLNSEEFNLDKLDFVKYRIELTSIGGEMSGLDEEALKALKKCKKFLLEKDK